MFEDCWNVQFGSNLQSKNVKRRKFQQSTGWLYQIFDIFRFRTPKLKIAIFSQKLMPIELKNVII